MAEATGDLKVAPGVGGGEDRCAGADDVPDLADEELFGLLGLGDVVDACAAAAPISFGEFDELESGDQFEQVAGLLGNLLAVGQVTGIVVGDGEVAQASLRCAAAVLHHPLVDVAELRIPEFCQRPVDRVVGEQGTIMAEMVTAAAGVGDDGVELRRREKVDHPLRQRLGRIGFAIVSVKGAAAGLDGRRVDFAAVGQEDVRGIAIDVGEDEILDAAREQGDAVLLLRRRLDGADELRRELRRDGRALRLEATEILRKELGQAELTEGGLQAESLVKPEESADEAEQARAHEQAADCDRTPEAAGEGLIEAGGLDFGAGSLEQVGVIHAGRAGGLARQAAEAVTHLVGEGRRQL